MASHKIKAIVEIPMSFPLEIEVEGISIDEAKYEIYKKIKQNPYYYLNNNGYRIVPDDYHKINQMEVLINEL